eukprot:6214088-Pleurochrysis_carterae.AAC.2
MLCALFAFSTAGQLDELDSASTVSEWLKRVRMDVHGATGLDNELLVAEEEPFPDASDMQGQRHQTAGAWLQQQAMQQQQHQHQHQQQPPVPHVPESADAESPMWQEHNDFLW